MSFDFDGVTLWPSDEYGLLIDASEIYQTPEKDYEFVDIPGMNGSLIFDNKRYSNVTIPVKCLIKSDFDTYFNRLMNFLLSRPGYCDMLLPGDDTHYRMAVFRRALKADTWELNKRGQFTLEFDAKPQRYLISGNRMINCNDGDTITNPYEFDAKPFITIYGNATLVMQSYNANYAIEVSGVEDDDYVNIDCEAMTCKGAHDGNMSSHVTIHDHEYPLLNAMKTTTISFSTDSQVAHPLIITPRWWEL